MADIVDGPSRAPSEAATADGDGGLRAFLKREIGVVQSDPRLARLLLAYDVREEEFRSRCDGELDRRIEELRQVARIAQEAENKTSDAYSDVGRLEAFEGKVYAVLGFMFLVLIGWAVALWVLKARYQLVSWGFLPAVVVPMYGILLVFGSIIGVIRRLKRGALERAERSAIIAAFKRAKEELYSSLASLIVEPVLAETTRPRFRNVRDESVPTRTTMWLTSSVPDSSLYLETSSHSLVVRHLRRLGGATVGLAGPRGAGKSELMRQVCKRDADNPLSADVVGVLVPAPVAYDPSSFLRQLVLQLSRNVPGYREPSISLRRKRVLSWDTKLVLIGVLLLLVAIMIPLRRSLSWDDAIRPLLVVGWIAIYIGVVGLLARSRLGFVKRIRDNLKLLLLRLKWFLRQGPLQAPPGKPRISDDFTSATHRAAAREAEAVAGRVLFQETRAQGRSVQAQWKGLGAAGSQEYTLTRESLTEPALVDELRRLTSILVHRGGYRVVIGIDELDKLEADEQAEKFLNSAKVLFTISDCSFLMSVSESALARFALRGLEIRDVFDSSFDAVVELRPLSYFECRDLLVLRAHGAREHIGLGRDEVPDRPLTDAEVLFAYCMSGGGPRDLLRYARMMIEISVSRGLDVGFDAVMAELLEREVKDKVKGILLSVRGLSRVDTVSTLVAFSEAAEAEWCLPSLPGMVKGFLAEDQGFMSMVDQSTNASPDPNDNPRSAGQSNEEAMVRDFRRELATYLYFLNTVRAAFQTDFNTDEAAGRGLPDGFSALAEARQRMEVNVAAAWRATSAARVVLDL